MAEVKNIAGTKENTAETSKDVEVVTGEVVLDGPLIVKLSKKYTFEGETVSEIDFTGLESVTAKDMMRANKTLARTGGSSGDLVPEITLPYALIIAEECTKYPIAFYEKLNPRDAMKVRTTVVGFMFGEE